MFDVVTASSSTVSLDIYGFLTILLLMFGLFLVLAGAFTAYFGSGKSRSIGVGLLVGGVVIGLLAGYWYHIASAHLGGLLWGTFLVLVAALLGALVAIGIFLVAIMKS